MTSSTTPAPPAVEARIAAWERRTRNPIILAAIAPFLVRLLAGERAGLNLAVDMAAWAIFAFDFVGHLRIHRRYWRTGRGLFDETILLLTFPWYVFPALGNTAYMAVFRWARIGRLLYAGGTGRRFFTAMQRLGTLGVALAATSVLASLIVMRHEPAESGFDSFGDSLWWAMVSFTTVGYGDLYPTTTAGRVAGGMMMFMGLIALGTVSGVLASVFAGSADEDEPGTSDPARDKQDASGAAKAQQSTPGARPDQGDRIDLVLRELQHVRAEVADLRRHLESRGGPSAAAGNDGTAPA